MRREGVNRAMSRQWIVVGMVVVGLVAGAAALASFGPEGSRVEVGARAPDFRAIDLATGDSVSFREHYDGAVTLVNIWATWCLPCRVEMPAMERVYRELAPRGFKIAAVSIDEGGPNAVREFAQGLDLTFDLLQDRSSAVQQIFQTTGVPESFLINKDGIIVKRIIGAHDWSSPVNRALVERLLDETGR
jgi:peroxiredoxin